MKINSALTCETSLLTKRCGTGPVRRISSTAEMPLPSPNRPSTIISSGLYRAAAVTASASVASIAHTSWPIVASISASSMPISKSSSATRTRSAFIVFVPAPRSFNSDFDAIVQLRGADCVGQCGTSIGNVHCHTWRSGTLTSDTGPNSGTEVPIEDLSTIAAGRSPRAGSETTQICSRCVQSAPAESGRSLRRINEPDRLRSREDVIKSNDAARGEATHKDRRAINCFAFIGLASQRAGHVLWKRFT